MKTLHFQTTYRACARLIASVTLLSVFPTFAEQYGDFIYEKNASSIIIAGYTGHSQHVTIPDKIEGLPVTQIRLYSFYNFQNVKSIALPNTLENIEGWVFSYSKLESITIPSGVTNIGSGSFYGCSSLTNIAVESSNLRYSSAGGALLDKNQTQLLKYPEGKGGSFVIPNTVTNLDYAAFDNCAQLSGVTLGSGITEFQNSWFYGCTNLASIEVDAQNAFFSSVDGLLLDKDQHQFIQCPFGRTGNVTVPDAITSINYTAFDSCSCISSVVLGKNVASIGYYYGPMPPAPPRLLHSASPGLTMPPQSGPIGIPRGGMMVGLVGSQRSRSLTSWRIIPNGPFSECASLTNIAVDPLNSNFRSVVGVLFNGNGKMLLRYPRARSGKYSIPDNVSCITATAFLGCDKLTDVTIPNMVTNIQNEAFLDCTGLSNIMIPGGVTSIGKDAFYGCAKLTSFVVDAANATFSSTNGVVLNKAGTSLLLYPYGRHGSYTVPLVSSIGPDAFRWCVNLTGIRIPTSVTNIGAEAFFCCEDLKNVTLPNSIVSIGQSSFLGCSGLYTITLPSSVSSVGDNAFSDCSSLRTITIPNSVTNLGTGVLSSCYALEKAILHCSISVLPEKTFYWCESLSTVTIPNSVTSIGQEAFAYCRSLKKIELPKGLIQISSRSFCGSGLKSITIPCKVDSIQNDAWEGCDALNGIVVDSANTNYSGLGGALFDADHTTLISCPRGNAGSYVVPAGVTSIGALAFSSQTLTNITIPSTVTNVGAFAFSGCWNLKSILFEGNAPAYPDSPEYNGYLYSEPYNATAYYKPGASGWGSYFAGIPTAVWALESFAPIRGTYSGLFTNTDGADLPGSGSISAAVDSHGRCTIQLKEGKTTYSGCGQFGWDGTLNLRLGNTALSPVASLECDLNGADQLRGTITGSTWTSHLVANRNVFSGANPTITAGIYTMALAASDNGASEPGGYGYGAVRVDANGNVAFSGSLGDGTVITLAATVSKNGDWPFYTTPYTGQGAILGWLRFTNAPDRDIDGVLTWVKPAKTKDKLYQAGFTNQIEAAGSAFDRTVNSRVLDFTNGLISLANGNLPTSQTNQFVLKPNNTASGSGVSVGLSRINGLFSGTVTPTHGKSVKVRGAVLQKQNTAYGLFTGTNQTGAVIMEGMEVSAD